MAYCYGLKTIRC